jgi:hypothetical protein
MKCVEQYFFTLMKNISKNSFAADGIFKVPVPLAGSAEQKAARRAPQPVRGPGTEPAEASPRCTFAARDA